MLDKSLKNLLETNRSLLCSARGTRVRHAIARSSGRPGRRGGWMRVRSFRLFLVLCACGLMSGWMQIFDPGTNLRAPATVFNPASTLQ